MPARPMKIDEMGDGRVERLIRVNGKELPRGTKITHAVLAAMPTANRNALIENGFITAFPKNVVVRDMSQKAMAQAGPELQRRAYVTGVDTFDVVDCVVVAAGVARAEADMLINPPKAPEPAKPKAKAKAKRGQKGKARAAVNARPKPPPPPDAKPAHEGGGPADDQANGPVD